MVTSSTPGSSNLSSVPTEEELTALAQMTGYRSGDATEDVPESESADTSDDTLLDEDDLNEANVSQTVTPIWSNPFAKGSFVAFLMALAFGSVGLFLMSVNHHWNQQETANLSQPPAAIPATPNPQSSEIGDLKTKEALGSQNQLLQQNARDNGGHLLPQSQTKPSPAPIPVASPRSVPVDYSVPTRSYTPTPRLTLSTPSARSTSFATPASSRLTQAVDPQQAWQAAQALGSYGQTSTPQPAAAQPIQPPGLDSPTGSAAGDQQRYDDDAAALLSGSAVEIATIAPGTTAQAELITPIIWAQDLKPEDQPQRFNIQLSEPLKAEDGSTAFPSGTKLVASVSNVSESGLMELAVANAIIPTSNGSKIVSVPPGAIVISSDGGKPLIAENYESDRGALLGHDIETALLGALSEVGSLLNRPLNESTTTSPYLSSTSVTNGNTNIVGGILEGGFSALQSSLSQREQSQIQTVLSRPSIWYIKAGKPMQIFVNSPVEVRL